MDVSFPALHHLSLNCLPLLRLGQPFEGSLFGGLFLLIEELIRKQSKDDQTGNYHKKVFISTFGIGRYSCLVLIKSKSLSRIWHVPFLNFNLNVVDIFDGFEGTVKLHIFLVLTCLL